MQRFRFDFALPFSLPLRFLGIRPGSASVDVGDDHLAVSFGPWHLVTPLDNVEDVQVTGPYNPLKAYGVRVSLSDLGVTFGTASAGGVCISFREPVAAAFPGGLVRHPSLTVTVDDPERLRRVLLHEAHARPVLAAVADVSSRPDAEPDEQDRRSRDRAVRQARKAARKRAEQRVAERVAEREEAERATARRSAAGKRGAAKRAQARTEGQRPTKKSDRQRPAKKAASARGTSTRTRTPAQRVTAVSGSADRAATGTVTRTANTSKNRSATR